MEDDDEYFGSLMEKASSGDVVEYTWYECVEGFKKADRDMGSLFQLKKEWMNRAEASYFADNGKMAGFVKQFAEDCAISYDYAKKINRARKVQCTAQNFSHDVVEALLSAPEDLREDFLSSEEPVKVKEIQEAKKEYKQVQEMPEFADIKEKVEKKEITPREAITEKKARMPVVNPYNVGEAMGAVKGIAEMFGKRYEGTPEEAASILVGEIIKGCEQDDIGMSIARDYVKWFLEFKQALDLAEPALLDFLEEKPNLKIVN
jgi:hypothetical protein